MIRFYKKVSFIKVYQTWFSHRFKFWDTFSFNAYLHIQDPNAKKVIGIKGHSNTIELRLDQPEEKIFADFAKQIRQQFRIATDEGIVCTFHEDYDGFVEFFNDFASTKGIFLTSKRRLLEMQPYVKLTYASFNGQVLAAHSYIEDEEMGVVRHFHSATKRFDENCDRNLIGRANKLLTVNSILHYKAKGYKVFDFGGYEPGTHNESLVKINQYKLLFGGKVVDCVNYYTFGYYLLKKLGQRFWFLGKKTTV